jgi:hypothetical protein
MRNADLADLTLVIPGNRTTGNLDARPLVVTDPFSGINRTPHRIGVLLQFAVRPQSI